MSKFTTESAREFLHKAGLFYYDDLSDLDEGEDLKWLDKLNLNDTFGWGCADCEDVTDEEYPVLAELYWKYGYCGMLYWVSKKRDWERSEFKDINRFIDFVKHEEELVEKVPGSSKRAYTPYSYTLG